MVSEWMMLTPRHNTPCKRSPHTRVAWALPSHCLQVKLHANSNAPGLSRTSPACNEEPARPQKANYQFCGAMRTHFSHRAPGMHTHCPCMCTYIAWGEPHTVRTPNNVIRQRDYAAVALSLPVLSGGAVAEKELSHILLCKQAPQVIEFGLYLI